MEIIFFWGLVLGFIVGTMVNPNTYNENDFEKEKKLHEKTKLNLLEEMEEHEKTKEILREYR